MAQGGRRGRGRPRSASSDTAATTVQALDRGIQVLATLSQFGRATLTDLAVTAEMAPSTVHRLLETLRQHSIVEFDEVDQTWAVGVEAFRIGSTYLLRANYIDAGRQMMRRMVERTGETANLGVPDAGDVVFVSQVETQQPIRAFFPPGTRGHMHASGIGKALLAEMSSERVAAITRQRGLPAFTDNTITTLDRLNEDLAATRTRGWAIDDQERQLGMRCLAAPIFNEFREIVAGISISGPAVRLPDDKLAEFGPLVRESADEVTHRIGGARP
ncbi:HTH-type transcriptional regulator BhcR [Rhodovibrio salinarum]|uniref:IclR family transcriptional regulator n=1 Tax=Rhodovibrio salinarum TaxID=1087 RepID=A0A934V1R1_9PROT|nr:HTH-type transcriptional regulator BhcR [Rhodovibrio salinarum]MBK1698770.1 IclR family transcriptional regulator [Rhodovibrio salinarum]